MGSFLSLRILLGLTLLSLWVAVPAAIRKIDPRATYLRTNQDPDSPPPVPINLEAIGVRPGDIVSLRITGNFAFSPNGIENGTAATAVFSSNSQVLASEQLNRVPGALDAGLDFTTPVTIRGELPTDIPEDFLCDGSSIVVPDGARYLFVSSVDEYFGDNEDRDNDFYINLATSNARISGLFFTSNGSLYALNPNTLVAELVGPLTMPGFEVAEMTYFPGVGFIAIAYDIDQARFQRLIRIDPLSGRCTLLADLGDAAQVGYVEGIEYIPSKGLICAKADPAQVFLTRHIQTVSLRGLRTQLCDTGLDNDYLVYIPDQQMLFGVDPNGTRAFSAIDLLTGQNNSFGLVPTDMQDMAFDQEGGVGWAGRALSNSLYRFELVSNNLTVADAGAVPAVENVGPLAWCRISEISKVTGESLLLGKSEQGSSHSWQDDDDDVRVLAKFIVPNQLSPFVRINLTFRPRTLAPTRISLSAKGQMLQGGAFAVSLSLLSFGTGNYVTLVSDATIDLQKSIFSGAASNNLNQFFDQTGQVIGRIEVRQSGPSATLLPSVAFDYAELWLE